MRRSLAKDEHNHHDDDDKPQSAATPVEVCGAKNRRKRMGENGKHDTTPYNEGGAVLRDPPSFQRWFPVVPVGHGRAMPAATKKSRRD
jgi:hypothetical protein